jgi:hypothetical protein
LGEKNKSWDESSIEKLAKEFLGQHTRKADGTAGDTEDSTFIEEAGQRDRETTMRSMVRDPVSAGFLGLLLWGGGFLYLRWPFVASVVLLLQLILGAVFGALSGILPSWMGNALLRDIGLTHQIGAGLVIVGALVVVVWWLSVVIPTMLVLRNRSLEYQPTQSPLLLLLSTLVPMLGHYIQGKFWRGHVYGLFFLMLPITLIGVIRIWFFSVRLLPAEAADLEAWFGILICGAAIAGLGVVLGFSVSVLAAFREIGWLQPQSELNPTEWKFVVLGTLLILCCSFYGFTGRPGDVVRKQATQLSAQLDERGFTHCARLVRTPTRWWEGEVSTIRDFTSLFW